MVPIRFLAFAAVLSQLPIVAWAQVDVPTPSIEYGTKVLALPNGETTVGSAKLDFDLPGNWLVCENHDLKGGRFFPGVQLYRVQKDDQGKLEVHLLEWTPPAAVSAAVKKSQQTHEQWWPSEDDVKLIAKELKATPGVVDPKRRGQHVVSTAKDFTPETRATKASEGAVFAIQSLFQPGERPAYGQSYFVKKATPNELSGDFTLGALPTDVKGAPMPLGTTGVFRWIRLPAS